MNDKNMDDEFLEGTKAMKKLIKVGSCLIKVRWYITGERLVSILCVGVYVDVCTRLCTCVRVVECAGVCGCFMFSDSI